jgi:hypothetical protein
VLRESAIPEGGGLGWPMSWIVRTFVSLALMAGAGGAFAQSPENPGVDIFTEGLVAPNLESTLDPPADTLVAPESYAPPLAATPAPAAPGESHDLVLEARLVAEGPVLTEGLIWRVFSTQPNAEGQLPLVDTAEGGTTTLRLASGDYLVHAAFGRAGATKRVTIADDDQMESVVLDAGGLRLDAVVGDGRTVAADQLNFEIQQQDETGEMVTVVPNATPARVLRLSAGAYHVVSRYGTVNAVVRADIQVEAGKLTEAVMRHTGAEVTLKLVSVEGGEALANTSWTVTTQDGLEVHQSVGAFPSIVLAAGNYTAVAQHQEQIYSRDFAVEAGLERDIEVRLSDLVQPEVGPPPVTPGSGGDPMEP